jgi:predicted aspartyl protease
MSKTRIDMGTFTIGCQVKNHASREKSVTVPRLMVDTGAEATWIPRKLLKRAEIKPEKRQTYRMANGELVYRDVGYAIIRVGQRETIDEVVFAEEGDFSLLGARSLEGLLLWVDPRNKRLIEIDASPISKVIVPGKPSPHKDRSVSISMIIPGEAGPVTISERRSTARRRKVATLRK